jgi:dTMP kinase
MAGRFIALEGPDGSGKSTHARRLAEDLGAVLTREPGGTPIGEAIRALVLDPTNVAMSDRTEALLYAADRAQHATEVVRPALDAGRHVVSDRSVYSSIAYQGFGRSLGADRIREISAWALDGCWPDLVIVLTLSPESLAKRMHRELDRIERADAAFFAQVAAGFETFVRDEPERVVIVDADRPHATVAADVRAAVRTHLSL